jgi:hypothetical protein
VIARPAWRFVGFLVLSGSVPSNLASEISKANAPSDSNQHGQRPSTVNRPKEMAGLMQDRGTRLRFTEKLSEPDPQQKRGFEVSRKKNHHLKKRTPQRHFTASKEQYV